MLDDSFRKRFKNIPIAISSSINYGADQHNHSEFELLYFESGKQTVKIGNKTYQTKAGDLILVNPMEIHSFSVDKTSNSLSKCVCFDCLLILNPKISESLLNGRAYVSRYISGDSVHAKPLRELFLKIYEACESASEISGDIFEMEIKSYLTLYFAYVFKNLLLDVDLDKPKSAEFCSSVISYVKDRYSENISSKDVASALSFNQSYFCRNFRRNFGVNFSEYLKIYRLSISRKLLEEKKSVSEVAFDVGFQNVNQFSKCFKEKFGVLPSKYKQKSQ